MCLSNTPVRKFEDLYLKYLVKFDLQWNLPNTTPCPLRDRNHVPDTIEMDYNNGNNTQTDRAQNKVLPDSTLDSAHTQTPYNSQRLFVNVLLQTS